MSSVMAAPRRDETAALMARVASSAASGVARRALVLRLSRLPAAYARPHHLRLARAALDPLRLADRAEMFHLPNADTAVLWRGPGGRALQASLEAVAELFADGTTPAPAPESLCLLLDLPAQAESLLQLARESRERPVPAPPPPRLLPLDPGGLAALEAALARADLARFVRRRPVCAIAPDGRFRLAFEKRMLSIAELEADLAPGRSFRAEPWLFRRLTRTLDRRMLALLAGPGELRDARPFAVNLNIASLLAPEFLRLDEALPARLRGEVVICLRAPDILADLPAFLFARGFAQARGYRLMLRIDDPELLRVLPPARLGVDLVQLNWGAALREADCFTVATDGVQVILSEAHSKTAVEWGRTHNITLYVGDQMDRFAARHHR
ncbi:MAG TPA: hypothetical protein VFN46_01685 [Acetobacteraceae bacterium]|nr:hypothetical protein [Acetobacteraceae bacterium]